MPDYNIQGNMITFLFPNKKLLLKFIEKDHSKQFSVIVHPNGEYEYSRQIREEDIVDEDVEDEYD